jgi:hypothetical protein
MHKLHFLTAVAAAAFLAGSVQAQSPAVSQEGSLSRNPATGPTNPPPEAQPMPTASVTGAVPVGATAEPSEDVARQVIDVVVVTNGPVKDTAENRAKYPPESRGGTRTAALGN